MTTVKTTKYLSIKIIQRMMTAKEFTLFLQRYRNAPRLRGRTEFSLSERHQMLCQQVIERKLTIFNFMQKVGIKRKAAAELLLGRYVARYLNAPR